MYAALTRSYLIQVWQPTCGGSCQPCAWNRTTNTLAQTEVMASQKHSMTDRSDLESADISLTKYYRHEDWHVQDSDGVKLLLTEGIDVIHVLCFSLRLYVLNVKSDYCEHVLMNWTGPLLVVLTSDWYCPARVRVCLWSGLDGLDFFLCSHINRWFEWYPDDFREYLYKVHMNSFSYE